MGAVASADELTVLRLHMAGTSGDAIARRLGVSVTTVRRMATRVRRRLGARTRAEAIAMLAASGALDLAASGHEDRTGDPRTPHTPPREEGP